jgi:hypothetical protein
VDEAGLVAGEVADGDFLGHDYSHPYPVPLVLDRNGTGDHQLNGLAGRQVPARKRSLLFAGRSGDLRISVVWPERRCHLS